MNITIIEPHGDDAFISCSSAMMYSGATTHVITMSDRDSEGIKKYYPSVVSTRYLDIPDVHYDYHLKYSTHEIHRRYKNGDMNLYDEYIESMNHLLSVEGAAAESYDDFMYVFLKKQINLELHPDSILLLPLGLFHPNHYTTRRVIESHRLTIPQPIPPIIYYVDKPYIEKRYMREILATASSFKYYTAPVQDKESRAAIYKSVYPTEQSLLRFSSETILEWKDIYAVDTLDESNPLVLEFLNNVSDIEKGEKYENLVCHAHKD